MNRKMFHSITLVNLSFLTILFFTFISCQLEQLPLTDPQSDDPLKEGSYSAYIINDPALKKRWSRSKAMVYKPLGPYISFNFNIGDFNNPYLIKVHPYFGEFDPALSSIYLDDQEFPIKKIVAQGSSYIGFKNMSFQDWVNIKTNKLLLKLKLGFQEDHSFKNKTFRYAYLDKSSYGELFNWRDLQNMKEKLDGDYRLMRDITFPEPGTEGFPANGFEPVGSYANPFTGSLDGNSKTISGLYIDRSGQSGVGLFGAIDNDNDDIETVKRLTIVYKKISGRNAVGSLAGSLIQGKVNHIRAINYSHDSTISGVINGVGGLIGVMHNSSMIDNGISQGEVIAGSIVGGLVGKTDSSSSIKGYSSADVTGGLYTGGLVGLIGGTGAIIGYATGNVTGAKENFQHAYGVGGLTGFSFNNSGVTIIGYATGTVEGRRSWNIGGLAGANGWRSAQDTVVGYSTGRVINGVRLNGGLVGGNDGIVKGYWDIASSDQSSSAGGTGISSIANVVYDESDQTYRDTATGNEVFNDPTFNDYFELPQRSGKWPILKESVIGSDLYEDQKALMGWTNL